MYDFSNPETKALFESEVRKLMEAPFLMSRTQAEMLVAVLMTEPHSTDDVSAATERNDG